MRTITSLKAVINDPERKSLPSIFWETIHSGLIERELPIHYFNNLLYKKEADDYRNYIGFKKGYNIINNFYYINGKNPQLENKVQFDQIALNNDIRIPKILATNNQKKINFNNESIEVNSIEEFKSIIYKMLNNSSDDSVFVKPFDGLGGANSFKVTKNSQKEITGIYSLLDTIEFIFQEMVVQDERINKIYSQSINTMRIHVYKNNSEIKITSAMMRFGRNGSSVDNVSQGGFFVPLDLKEWKLSGIGKTFLKHGGYTYKKHPDTGIKLDGYQLPYKKEVFDLVLNASKHFDTKFIGWDIALTPTGPIIIEGNNGPHIFMLQMAAGGIRNHPIYNDLFEEFI